MFQPNGFFPGRASKISMRSSRHSMVPMLHLGMPHRSPLLRLKVLVLLAGGVGHVLCHAWWVRGEHGTHLWRARRVYIAGGIAPRILDFLVNSEFRRRFEDKGRLGAYLGGIPTQVIVHPAATFLGLTSLLGSKSPGSLLISLSAVRRPIGQSVRPRRPKQP